jgi:hypothetical protein
MAPAVNARRVVKETMLMDLVLWVGRLLYGRLMCCGKLLLGQSLVMYQTTLRGSSASYTRVQRIVRNLFP